MKWTVVSTTEADNELTDIYLHAEYKRAITEAANRIEKALRSDADNKGEDFYGDRIYQDGPLAAVYELVPDDRLVRIILFMRIRS